MTNPATIGDWLTWAQAKIPRTDATAIALCCFAPKGTDPSWLVTHENHPLPGNPDLLEHARNLVSYRHQGVPLAYLFGTKNFYGRDFLVTRDVLIPRPESEQIIDLAKTLALPPAPRILDVGTGSGCLAITLALEFPEATVLGLDNSKPALQIARKNNETHQSQVTFLESDLLSSLRPEIHDYFDLIVANLPYVNPGWDWLDQYSLSFEPFNALYPEQGSTENGLSDYRRLFEQLANHHITTRTTYLLLEADPCQHTDLIALASSYRYQYHTTNGYILALHP